MWQVSQILKAHRKCLIMKLQCSISSHRIMKLATDVFNEIVYYAQKYSFM